LQNHTILLLSSEVSLLEVSITSASKLGYTLLLSAEFI